MAKKKPSLGRQKIKIAKIEKPSHRQVTFSKRRSGLFKKACELCTLCGVEVAIVVFSPAHKVFSFGHPNVDSLVDKFLNNNNTSTTMTRTTSACANARVQELNAQLTRVEALVEAEGGRREALERVAEGWWEAPVGMMGRGELQRLSASLEELKETVVLQAKTLRETTSFSDVNDYAKMAMEELIPAPAGYGIGRGFGGFGGF